jgi:hypothetical protein
MIASLADMTALAQVPEVILRPSSQIPQSVALTIRPHSTSWVLLESSSDLVIWQPLVNLLTTNSSGPFVDYPPTNSLVRFYRVSRPGVSAAQALSSWEAVRPACFQYVFQNTKLDGGGVVWVGTVTLSNGVKMVSGVTANGFAVTTYDPDDFLTPEEVFALVASVESQGVKLAHVVYDQQWSFPASVVIVSSGSAPITDYRMSGLVNLSVAARQVRQGAANRRPMGTAESTGHPTVALLASKQKAGSN